MAWSSTRWWQVRISTVHTHTLTHKCQDSSTMTKAVLTHQSVLRWKLLKMISIKDFPGHTIRSPTCPTDALLPTTQPANRWAWSDVFVSPFPQNNGKKIWELIGNMFKCLAWSAPLGRKSRFKLWKQSVALKKQLRHNWNHHPAQKPAGNPPHAPWCQHTWFQAGTKIITKRVRGAEHCASFQIWHLKNLNLSKETKYS